MIEIVLIILLGYSPSGATGTSMEVLEYVQPSIIHCQSAKKGIEYSKRYPFKIKAMCVTRLKKDAVE